MNSAEQFSFKLDGCPASVALHTGTRSFLSRACAERVGLHASGNGCNAALSVLFPAGWSTCVMDFCICESLSDSDLCLGLDWRGHIKELCNGTGIILPPNLVCIQLGLCWCRWFLYCSQFSSLPATTIADEDDPMVGNDLIRPSNNYHAESVRLLLSVTFNVLFLNWWQSLTHLVVTVGDEASSLAKDKMRTHVVRAADDVWFFWLAAFSLLMIPIGTAHLFCRNNQSAKYYNKKYKNQLLSFKVCALRREVYLFCTGYQ